MLLTIAFMIATVVFATYLKVKKFKRKIHLSIVFIVRGDINMKPRHTIEMSCTSILHLYKLNKRKRNMVTIRNWELIGSPKSFYQSPTLEAFNKCIEICNQIKLTHVVLKLKDNSPGILAVGPISKKRIEKIASGLPIFE